MEWWLTLLLFVSGLLVFFFLRVPVAFGLLATNLIAAVWMFGFGPGSELLIGATESSLTTFVLTPIPLFILMGELLYQSGVVNRVVVAFDRAFQRVPGRLPLLTIGTGTVFGVLSGSTSASTALLGRTMLPDMVAAGYPRQVALGSVLGSGGLAMILPPSALAIIWGATAGVSISALFMAGIVPGLLMATGYVAITVVRGLRAARDDRGAATGDTGRALLRLVRELVPVVGLLGLVLGGIFGGWFTPTESGAIGVVGAALLAVTMGRIEPGFWRRSGNGAAKITVMAFFIVAGSSFFSNLVSFSGAAGGLVSAMTDGVSNQWVALLLMMGAMLILGTFFEAISMMLVTIPLFMPIVAAMGWDPVWFSILGLINLQIATTTPPFGMSLFVLKGVVGNGFRMTELYRAALPFVASDLLVMSMLAAFPFLVTALPSVMAS